MEHQVLSATALVVVRGPDARHSRGLGCPLAVTEGGFTTVTCSGVALPSGSPGERGRLRVLVPASAVSPFVDVDVSAASDPSPVGGTAISVSFPSNPSSSSLPARVIAWVKLEGADAALSRLEREGWETGWSLSLSPRPLASPALPRRSSLSPPARPPAPSAAWLAVLECEEEAGGDGEASREAADALWGSVDEDEGLPLRPGTPLLAAGAPFGGLSSPHFSGCVLSGSLSAVVSDGGAPPLFLADVPSALPGSDGGPVVAVEGRRRFVGVLAPPLRRRDGGSAPAAPAGLPLVVSAEPLARALRDLGLLLPTTPSPSEPPDVRRPPPPLAAVAPAPASAPAGAGAAAAVAAASPSVVALLVPGSSWATAVHVGGGAFLTAGHALPPGPSSPFSSSSPSLLLQLRTPSGSFSWEPAEVDRRPLPELARGLDVAVVRLSRRRRDRRDPLPPAATLSPSPPPPASPVAVVGFPRVHPRASLGPLSTLGVVSRTLGAGGQGEGIEEMMLTTAAVHAGASGGAVVDASTGGVAALVVSNTRHLSSGTTLPHLNFSVCGPALASAWRHARGLTATKAGCRPPSSGARAALWALAAVPRPPSSDEGGERRPRGPEALERLLERVTAPPPSADWPSRL